ncbi:ribonucleases P/MRP protein subunit POP1-domain-containing protein [Phlyctochytrium arcticum]|nr:ribonucleases P/MRP protein subunit POP1-domain-containing protein [Phlyctochytrium arcticum]
MDQGGGAGNRNSRGRGRGGFAGTKRGGEPLTPRDRKKARQAISLQVERPLTPTPAPSTTTENAGKASVKGEGVSMEEPLRTLSVVEFVEARAFELCAMERALENSTEKAGQHRVFQTVPRYMRRRAASHNVKRLPRRLRARALAQMAKDPGPEQQKKGKKPACRRKSRRSVSLRSNFINRQKGKGWLETHVWHAKRMKMVNIWGYKISRRPNDKSFKASLRAAKQECILRDVSYQQVFELYGSVEDINKLLLTLTDPTLPLVGSARFISGKRQGSTFFYEYMQYPSKAIGPVTFIWRTARDPPSDNSKRTLWLWLHPAVYSHIANLIRTTTADMKLNIRAHELKNEVLRFELTGPRSQAILTHTLNVAPEDSLARTMWGMLRKLRSPASLPPGAVLALSVYDPRLNFPPKMPPRARVNEDFSIEESKAINDWDANLARSAIWDKDARRSCSADKPSESVINSRKSNSLIPGTKLQPQTSDVIVPILLVQRNTQPLERTPSGTESREFTSGWDMIVPKNWGMDFWKQLVFAGARVGGLRESNLFHFESGIPCFPQDFPETSSHEALAARKAHEVQCRWERTPPAKRPNYVENGTKSPFRPPFDTLQQTGTDIPVTTELPLGSIETDTIPGQAGGCITVLNSPVILQLLNSIIHSENFAHITTKVLDKLWQVTEKRFGDRMQLANINQSTTSQSLIRIRLTVLRKGCPGNNAIIYSCSQDEYSFWLKALAKSSDDWMADEDHNLLDRVPSENQIVGYLTTGQFSYAEGKGQGIGCCRLSSLVNVFQDGKRCVDQNPWIFPEPNPDLLTDRFKRKYPNFLLVRGVTGRVCVPATFTLIP